ncbi:DsrE family protein [Psychrobacter sp. NPDC078370]|uniref:DsrE family protein n=1 Tax=unclassified Psychrobacter TaxID=196806 RepID=UPI000C7F5857|nr:DsrE family protein [Psychrobacter sp. MES7-P7E]PLT20690.1 sulfur reduction protein DsrE [Psychrobacter sp. MES7-P7E]|tara:strand:- start:274 stop:651 length:378 start_codon:yes stop_codon:yes gene_type:complete
MANTTDYVGTLFDNSESNPSKITLAFTMAGVALKKGHSATVILIVDAVHLAKPNALDNVDIGDPFEPAGKLLEAFIEKGGQVLVCGACMKHNGVEESDIDKRFEVISGDDVVELLMNAKGSLQLN